MIKIKTLSKKSTKIGSDALMCLECTNAVLGLSSPNGKPEKIGRTQVFPDSFFGKDWHNRENVRFFKIFWAIF